MTTKPRNRQAQTDARTERVKRRNEAIRVYHRNRYHVDKIRKEVIIDEIEDRWGLSAKTIEEILKRRGKTYSKL